MNVDPTNNSFLSVTALFFLIKQTAGGVPLPLGVGFFCTAVTLFSLRWVPQVQRGLSDSFDDSSNPSVHYATPVYVKTEFVLSKVEGSGKQDKPSYENPICANTTLHDQPLHKATSYLMSQNMFIQALILGFAQGCALIVPGLSRLAVVYATARWLGMPARKAFPTAWLLVLPLFGAAVLRSSYWFVTHGYFAHLMRFDLLCVVFFATIAAYYAFAGVAYLARTERLWWLSLYMLVPITLWLWRAEW